MSGAPRSKVIAQHTLQKRRVVEKIEAGFGISLEPDLENGSETSQSLWGRFKWFISFPARLYVHFVYDCRPATTSRETRAADWAKLHAPSRYLLSLLAPFGPPGYLVRNLRAPLFVITALILFNCTYETLYILYPDTLVEFSDPQTWGVFRLGSFINSLILSIKVNQVYSRIWLARQSFGSVGGDLNSAAQLMYIYAVECEREGHISRKERERLLRVMNKWMTVYPYALTMQLIDLDRLPGEAARLLSDREVALLEGTGKPRKYVLMKLQTILSKFKLETAQHLSVQHLLQSAEKNAGTCRRIKFTPLPYTLSNVCTGFIVIWLLILPFGITRIDWVDLAQTGHGVGSFIVSTWLTGFCLFLLSLMMLSVDEVANQLEDPFLSLPLFDTMKTALGHLSTVEKDFKALEAAEKVEDD